ncbi:MAG: hypothetical protein U9R08_07140 [Nanoarchaeota archaeon]|nr:hypothetical protein [Nanoarchaeota archaeon]
MKITNKILDKVIEELAGEDVVPLVRKLKNKKNVSEFKLAESINREINVTRNMLYRLYHVSLVSFTRKKDKKKGWYIYYWTFDMKRIKYLLFKLKRKRLEHLKERLKREQNEQFFLCPNKCIRLDFEQSMNFEFKCPECGTLIELEDNSKKVLEIEKEIHTLEVEFKEKLKREKSIQKAIKEKSEKVAVVKKKKATKKKVVKKKKKITKKKKVKSKKIKKKVIKKKPIKKKVVKKKIKKIVKKKKVTKKTKKK